jgi:hypothetical protein
MLVGSVQALAPLKRANSLKGGDAKPPVYGIFLRQRGCQNDDFAGHQAVHRRTPAYPIADHFCRRFDPLDLGCCPLLVSVADRRTARSEREGRTMYRAFLNRISGSGVFAAPLSLSACGGGGQGSGDAVVVEGDFPVAFVARNVEAVVSRTGAGAERGGSGGGQGDGRLAARSREEIERVFDRNKSAIFALYNRALRQDSTFRGKLVARVKMFRFEPREVATVTTTKPIDFFPA